MQPPAHVRSAGKPTTSLWQETRTCALLALPIIFGQVLQNSLTVIDTLMVGRIGVVPVAAASLGNALFVLPLVFGFGVMGPFSVFISRALARRELLSTVHHLRRGLVMALVLALGLASLITVSSGGISILQQPAPVVALARTFLLLITWSLIPMYLFQVLKQYCEALHSPWPPMLILGGTVICNVALNWILIFGHFGFPAMGLIGAGWATLIARALALAALATVIRLTHLRAPHLRREFISGNFDWPSYRALMEQGLPAGCQVILEVGAFSLAAIMIGWISETALAAHQVALAIASTTFMVPLGLSMAVAIRMGSAAGADDLYRARTCAMGSHLLAWILMGITAAAICLFRQELAACFVHDTKVVLLASQLLLVAGLFQVFDGTQIVSVGALRGLHDVKVPTLISLISYWLIGLPISYLLAFALHAGAVGIWAGLLVGLAAEAAILLARLVSLLR